MGINTFADILRTHAAERPDGRVAGARRAGGDVGRAVRAGRPGGRRPRRRRRRAAGPRRVPRQERHRALRGVLRRRARSTPCASTSTGGSPRPRSSTSSTTPRPRCFVVGPDFVPVLDAIADDLDDACKHRPRRSAAHAHGYQDYDDVGRRSTTPPIPASRRQPDDVAFQLYSSGTTGRPKGVMLTNDNFFALLPIGRRHVGASTSDAVNLVAMPLFHIGGGGWAIGRHVRRRARASSSASSTPPRSSRLIRRARHHPRLPRPGRAAVHADGARRRRRRLLDAAR